MGRIYWSHENLVRCASIKAPHLYFGQANPDTQLPIRTKIEVRCKLCNVMFTLFIHKVIYWERVHRCDRPSGPRTLWSPSKYLQLTKKFADVDFSDTDPNYVVHVRSSIYCKCKICGRKWDCLLRELVVYKHSGCPNRCTSDRMASRKYLMQIAEKHSIEIAYKFRFPDSTCYYNGKFSVGGVNFLILIDHASYFKKPGNIKEMKEHRLSMTNDEERFRQARKYGYKIIRIDYTQARNMEYHFERAIEECRESGDVIYLASPEKYVFEDEIE